VETLGHHRKSLETGVTSATKQKSSRVIQLLGLLFSRRLDLQVKRFSDTWAHAMGGAERTQAAWGRTRPNALQGFCGNATTPLLPWTHHRVEGTHRQLGAGSPIDWRDDPHRFTDIHQLVVAKAQP